MKDYSLKKLILTIIISVISIMSFCTLLFPLIEFSVANVSAFSENGFTYIKFSSIYLVDDNHIMLVISGIVCLLILLASIFNCILSVFSIFKGKDKDYKLRKTILIVSGIIAIAYMIIGLLDKQAISNELNGIGIDLYSTKSYIPLIITALLIAGYIICAKYIKDTGTKHSTINKYSRMSEEERIAMLLKYKELVKENIITSEEFEIKKREILLLDVKEEVKEKKENVKKSDEDLKMEQVMKYKKMYDDGIINEKEFTEMKKKVL